MGWHTQNSVFDGWHTQNSVFDGWHTQNSVFDGWYMQGSAFEGMSALVLLLVIGMFIFVIVSGLRQWNKNNNLPRLTVEAEVVAKRTSTSVHHNAANHAIHTSISYYVTFQVESGDRMELHVSGREYGTLAEGDFGRLTFQGTRYLGFERQR